MIRETAGNSWDGQWVTHRLDTYGTSAWRPLPDPRDIAGTIVSGSPALLTDRSAWMLEGEAYLRKLVSEGSPVLGICFGHQMLGQALGGRVASNEGGREIGTVEVEALRFDPHEYDPVLSPDVGSNEPPAANATHVESVVRLPSRAHVVAQTQLDPHAAVRFGETTWGVQFHPEFDAEIMRYYIEARADALTSEGLNPTHLRHKAKDTPYGHSVVRRFIEHAVKQKR